MYLKLRFDESSMSARYLTAEALVYISARRTDESVKQAALDLGILDFVIAQGFNRMRRSVHLIVADLTRSLPPPDSPTLAASLEEQKLSLDLLERYLRILYQMSIHHKKVQVYLTNNRKGNLLYTCSKLGELTHVVFQTAVCVPASCRRAERQRAAAGEAHRLSQRRRQGLLQRISQQWLLQMECDQYVQMCATCVCRRSTASCAAASHA